MTKKVSNTKTNALSPRNTHIITKNPESIQVPTHPTITHSTINTLTHQYTQFLTHSRQHHQPSTHSDSNILYHQHTQTPIYTGNNTLRQTSFTTRTHTHQFTTHPTHPLSHQQRTHSSKQDNTLIQTLRRSTHSEAEGRPPSWLQIPGVSEIVAGGLWVDAAVTHTPLYGQVNTATPGVSMSSLGSPCERERERIIIPYGITQPYFTYTTQHTFKHIPMYTACSCQLI